MTIRHTSRHTSRPVLHTHSMHTHTNTPRCRQRSETRPVLMCVISFQPSHLSPRPSTVSTRPPPSPADTDLAERRALSSDAFSPSGSSRSLVVGVIFNYFVCPLVRRSAGPLPPRSIRVSVPRGSPVLLAVWASAPLGGGRPGTDWGRPRAAGRK